MPKVIEDASTLAMWLHEAKAAHVEYEKMTGKADENWPEWYAEFIFQSLPKTVQLTDGWVKPVTGLDWE